MAQGNPIWRRFGALWVATLAAAQIAWVGQGGQNYRTAPPDGPERLASQAVPYAPGQIIIKFRVQPLRTLGGGLQLGGEDLAIRYGIHLKRVYPLQKRFPSPCQVLDGVYAMHYEGQITSETLAKELSTRSDVVFAEPNYRNYPDFLPDDPLFAEQYALNNLLSQPDRRKDLDCLRAWDRERGSKYITVGIVDSGIDYAHSDLRNRIWRNAGELSGDGLDNDANGYLDDVMGWNFVGENNDPYDDFGHGTHVAGIIGASADNNTGIAGVDHFCRLMAVRVGNILGYYNEDAALGVLYAVDNGANVINASWGSYQRSELMDAVIQYAYTKGVLIIAAAGNDNTDLLHFPAGYAHVLSVGSTDAKDQRSIWTSPKGGNYGRWIDLSAPGTDILSTFPNNIYVKKSGTSMAAPQVTGVASLVLAEYPRITPEELRARLLSTADPIDDDNPEFSYQLGAGRVNAARAIFDPPRPHLILKGFDARDSLGNGDRRLDPGETVEVWVELENIWRESGPLDLSLSTTDRFLQVNQAFSHLPSLAFKEDASNQALPFMLTLSSITPRNHKARMRLQVKGPETAYQRDFNFTLPLFDAQMDQPGWPFNAEKDITSSPVAADLDGDGMGEVVVCSEDQKVYVLSHRGEVRPGWPQETGAGIISTPAVADLDGDGRSEIIAGSMDQKVYAWDLEGNLLPGWPQMAGGHGAPSSLSIADLDADGFPDVVDGTWTGRLFAWNRKGEPLSGWPVFLSQEGINSSPALGDIDGDGFLDVVVACKNRRVYALDRFGRTLPGWPQSSEEAGFISAPALGDLDGDGDLEVVVGGNDGKIYAWHHEGTPLAGWPKELGTSFTASPALGDLDGDGTPEVAVGAEDGNVYVLTASGASLPGFPVKTGDKIIASCTIADLYGDGRFEVVTASGNYLHAFFPNGVEVPGWPLNLRDAVWTTPAIADLDGDGDLEVIAGAKNHKVFVKDCLGASQPHPPISWGTFHFDPAHTGVVANPTGQPKVELAGALPLGGEPAMAWIMALASDPDRDVAEVRCSWAGREVRLYDDGLHDDFGAGDGLYAATTSLSADEAVVEITAWDAYGLSSDPWPYLTVLPRSARHALTWGRSPSAALPPVAPLPLLFAQVAEGPVFPGPRVLAAGWGSASLTTTSGGPVSLTAVVYDPDGIGVTGVELWTTEGPSGVYMKEVATAPPLAVYRLPLNLPPGALPEGSWLVGLQAKDSLGRKGTIWPLTGSRE